MPSWTDCTHLWIWSLPSQCPQPKQRSRATSLHEWERWIWCPWGPWATSSRQMGMHARAMNIAELWPTVLSHPPCPVFPDHADVHWPRHWAQELKQLKDSQRCSSCALIKLPMCVAKICKPLIYFIRGLCTPGRRRPYRFPRTYRIRS